MSIINDALKKAQMRLHRHAHDPMPAHEDTKSTWPVASTVIIVIGFIASIVFLAFLIANYKQRVATPKIAVQHVDHPQPVRSLPHAIMQPAAARHSATTSEPHDAHGGLTLNGIIVMDGDYFALINNHILKEGDYIEKKRVVKITESVVEIYDRGEIIELRTTR